MTRNEFVFRFLFTVVMVLLGLREWSRNKVLAALMFALAISFWFGMFLARLGWLDE